MTALAEAVALASEKVSRCTLAGIFLALEDDDAATLTAMLADPTVTGSAIARGLTAIGHPVRPITINRHRNHGCACP